MKVRCSRRERANPLQMGVSWRRWESNPRKVPPVVGRSVEPVLAVALPALPEVAEVLSAGGSQ